MGQRKTQKKHKTQPCHKRGTSRKHTEALYTVQNRSTAPRKREDSPSHGEHETTRARHPKEERGPEGPQNSRGGSTAAAR